MLINTTVAKNPLNWLTVWLMLFLAGFALHLAMQALGFQPPQPKTPAGTPETNQNIAGVN